MQIEIHGHDLPGLRCRPRDVADGYENVYVGLQRRQDVVQRTPGDARRVRWCFEVEVVTRRDGHLDVRGPSVHGRPGARFLYLSVGDAELAAAAAPGSILVGALGLTMADGTPTCAAVRPPAISWTVLPANRAAGP